MFCLTLVWRLAASSKIRCCGPHKIITKSSKEKEAPTKFGVPPCPYILFRTFFTQNLVYFAHDWDIFGIISSPWTSLIIWLLHLLHLLSILIINIIYWLYDYCINPNHHMYPVLCDAKNSCDFERKKQQKLFRCENWFFSNTEAVLVDVRPKGSKLQKNGTTVHIREVLQKRWK